MAQEAIDYVESVAGKKSQTAEWDKTFDPKAEEILDKIQLEIMKKAITLELNK